MHELVKAAILGTLQGFTEFLPISSSGHLLVGRKLLGLAEAGLFLDTMLHVGTLLAVLIIFRADIMAMIRRPFSKLTLLVIWGTIPAAVIGLAFEDFFADIARTGVTVGWEFLITGAVLWAVESMRHKGQKDLDQITYTDAAIIGTLQGAAILPAISRSGFTIAGSLLRGLDRPTAARFSFLLSVPAILGAVVLQGKDLLGGQVESIGLTALLVGIATSALAGYAAIRWLISILTRGSLKVFSVYVWILGGLILLAQATGRW